MTTNSIITRGLAAGATVALAAILPAAASARPIASHLVPQSVTHSHISGARSLMALPPQTIARLQPGRNIYSHRRMGPDFAYTHAKVVFGSDFAGNEVDVFKQASPFPYVATLSDNPPHACGTPHLQGPQGMWVDHNRNLWVADTYNSDVREFPLGQTTSSMNLADPTGYPVDTSVDSSVTGNVYATNIALTSGGNGNIVVWTPPYSCNQLPTYTMSDPDFVQVYFISTDRLGDLYVDFIDPTNTAQVCFIAFANIGNNTSICTGTVGDFLTTVQLGWPGGMQVLPLPTSIAKMGIDDQIGNFPVAQGIGVYQIPLPSTGPRYLPCTNYSPTAAPGPFVDPVTFAFTNPKGYSLWASDAAVVSGGALMLASDKVCSSFLGTFNTTTITGFAQLVGTAVSPSVSP